MSMVKAQSGTKESRGGTVYVSNTVAVLAVEQDVGTVLMAS